MSGGGRYRFEAQLSVQVLQQPVASRHPLVADLGWRQKHSVTCEAMELRISVPHTTSPQELVLRGVPAPVLRQRSGDHLPAVAAESRDRAPPLSDPTLSRTHCEQGTPAQQRLPWRNGDRIPAIHRDQEEAGHELRRRGVRLAGRVYQHTRFGKCVGSN